MINKIIFFLFKIKPNTPIKNIENENAIINKFGLLFVYLR